VFSAQFQGRHSVVRQVQPRRHRNWRRDDVVESEWRQRNHDAWWPVAVLDVPRITCIAPTQDHRARTHGGDVADGGVIGLRIAIVTFVSPFISHESHGSFTGVLAGAVSKLDIEATTLLARPLPGPRWLTSVSLHSLSTGSLIGGRQSIIHLRTHAATSCRQYAENMATAQLSAALRRHPSEASGPSQRLPFLRSLSVIEDMLTGLPPGHPPPLPRGRGARPLRASRGRRGLARPPPPRRPSDHSRTAYGKPVWATSPRVPRHPRSRLWWPLAPPSRRLARAFGAPSPAPSPNPRTVRLSASRRHRLPSLTVRRGSNVPSRAVGSS
jgi:hypothetical protein